MTVANLDSRIHPKRKKKEKKIVFLQKCAEFKKHITHVLFQRQKTRGNTRVRIFKD